MGFANQLCGLYLVCRTLRIRLKNQFRKVREEALMILQWLEKSDGEAVLAGAS